MCISVHYVQNVMHGRVQKQVQLQAQPTAALGLMQFAILGKNSTLVHDPGVKLATVYQ